MCISSAPCPHTSSAWRRATKTFWRRLPILFGQDGAVGACGADQFQLQQKFNRAQNRRATGLTAKSKNAWKPRSGRRVRKKNRKSRSASPRWKKKSPTSKPRNAITRRSWRSRRRIIPAAARRRSTASWFMSPTGWKQRTRSGKKPVRSWRCLRRNWQHNKFQSQLFSRSRKIPRAR